MEPNNGPQRHPSPDPQSLCIGYRIWQRDPADVIKDAEMGRLSGLSSRPAVITNILLGGRLEGQGDTTLLALRMGPPPHAREDTEASRNPDFRADFRALKPLDFTACDLHNHQVTNEGFKPPFSFPRAAVTNDHKPNRSLSFHSSGGQKSEIRVLAGPGPLRA